MPQHRESLKPPRALAGPSEPELITRLREHDVDAFDELYRRHPHF